MTEQWSPEEKWANRIINYIMVADKDIDSWKKGTMVPRIANDFRLQIDEMLYSMFDFPEDFPRDDSTLSPLTFLRQLFGAGYVFFTDKAEYNDISSPGQPKGHGIPIGDGREVACWTGGLGGYTQTYLPAYITVANPYLKKSYQWNLEEDGVLIKCGPCMRGFGETIDKWAMLYAQSIVTMCADIIQSRVMTTVQARDDNARDAANLWYNDLWRGIQAPLVTTGKQFGVSEYNPIEVYPMSTNASQMLVSVIEMHQYIVSQCMHEIGLQSNQSMKREAINSAETGMNLDSLTPRPATILSVIKDAGKKIAEKYGVSWFENIRLNDAWSREQRITEAEAVIAESQAETVENTVDVDDGTVEEQEAPTEPAEEDDKDEGEDA